MAEPASLGDFFAKKKKKVVKGSNLNVAPAAAPKAEAKKGKGKDEEDGWEEEPAPVTNMKVETVGKLLREEEKKEDEDTSAAHWKPQKSSAQAELSDKKYPTLAKSVASTAINIDDGEPKVNIKTSKNMFATLDNADDDDDEPKRPKEIKPAMVQKKKGERETVAIQREVDKYSKKKGKEEGPSASRAREDEDSDEEDEEKEDAPSPVKEEPAKKKKEEKKEDKKEKAKAPETSVSQDVEEPGDAKAARAAYQEYAAEIRELVGEGGRFEDKVKTSDKERIEEAITESLEWLEAQTNEDADKAQIQAERKKLEGIIIPILSKAKYAGRKKFAPKPLPREELEEEKKAAKAKAKPVASKKKGFVEEDDSKKIAYAPDGW